MSTITNAIQRLRELAARRPKPIATQVQLPGRIPLVANSKAADRDQTIQETPLIELWPDNLQRPKNSDREAPYIPRGRHAEFNKLAELLEDPPQAVHLITGPPGCGKSTMLKTMVEYAHHQGFIAVKIAPHEFLEPTTVIESIRAQTLGDDLAGSKVDREIDQEITDHTNVKVEPLGIGGGHTRTTKDSEKQQRSTEGSPRLLAHLQDIITTLREQVPHFRGILIHCDEFQKLHPHSLKTANAHLSLSAQIYTLNEELRSNQPSLPIITLLAGIPPAHETLQNLLSRKSIATTIELLPVDGYPMHDVMSPHCTLILRDCLLASQKAHGHRLDISLPQLHIWGMDCRGHVLHANHAGIALQSKLREFHQQGKQQLNDRDIADIEKAIRDQRDQYYDGRINSIKSNLPTNTTKEEILTVTQHVAIAMHDAEPNPDSDQMPAFLTWDTVQKIAQAVLPDGDASRADDILQHLRHNGIISHMQKDGRFLHYEGPDLDVETEGHEIEPGPMDYTDCPIPTLSQHIRRTIPAEEQERIRNTVQQIIQERENLADTRWNWKRSVYLEELTRVDAFDYLPPTFPAVLTPREALEQTSQVLGHIQQDAATGAHPHLEQSLRRFARRRGLTFQSAIPDLGPNGLPKPTPDTANENGGGDH